MSRKKLSIKRMNYLIRYRPMRRYMKKYGIDRIREISEIVEEDILAHIAGIKIAGIKNVR